MIMLIMAHGTDENRVNEESWIGGQTKCRYSPAARNFGTWRHGSEDRYNY